MSGNNNQSEAMSNLQKEIQSLIEQRNRTGKEPLSFKDRLQLLNEVYDGVLILWKQSVLMGTAKGSSALSYQLERARLEMYDLERTHGKDIGKTEKRVIGWEYPEENSDVDA